jgi:hypothetical protein
MFLSSFIATKLDTLLVLARAPFLLAMWGLGMASLGLILRSNRIKTPKPESRCPLCGHLVQACDCAEAYMYVRRQERYVTAEDDTEE